MALFGGTGSNERERERKRGTFDWNSLSLFHERSGTKRLRRLTVVDRRRRKIDRYVGHEPVKFTSSRGRGRKSMTVPESFRTFKGILASRCCLTLVNAEGKAERRRVCKSFHEKRASLRVAGCGFLDPWRHVRSAEGHESPLSMSHQWYLRIRHVLRRFLCFYFFVHHCAPASSNFQPWNIILRPDFFSP